MTTPEDMEELKEEAREDALEAYPNLDLMTREEKLEAADEILDKILDGARAWQDPELNPPEAKEWGEMLEAFVDAGRSVVKNIRATSNKH